MVEKELILLNALTDPTPRKYPGNVPAVVALRGASEITNNYKEEWTELEFRGDYVGQHLFEGEKVMQAWIEVGYDTETPPEDLDSIVKFVEDDLPLYDFGYKGGNVRMSIYLPYVSIVVATIALTVSAIGLIWEFLR